MARARNIKPGFFKNETLADLHPLARLLFAGLWTIADREGRLEDRPKRIKAETLPYDRCDINDLLQSLHDARFIVRYGDNSNRYIQILTWKRHQNPHIKEAPSTIPAPCELRASTVPEQCENETEHNLGSDEHDTKTASSLNLGFFNPLMGSGEQATHTTPDALTDSPDAQNDSEKTVKPSPVMDEQWFRFKDRAVEYGIQVSEAEWQQAFDWGWRRLDEAQREAAIQGITERITAQDDSLVSTTPKNYLQYEKWKRRVRAVQQLRPGGNRVADEALAILERKQAQRSTA